VCGRFVLLARLGICISANFVDDLGERKGEEDIVLWIVRNPENGEGTSR
jgi:hypothetical protein